MEMKPRKLKKVGHKGSRCLDRGQLGGEKGLMPNSQAHEPSRIIARDRVETYGEVLTGAKEVNAMLDLVKQETERVDSRFLEPACGDGNFLAEVLRRKLEVVGTRYRRSQTDYERNALIALGSIYGIDIIEENAIKCRQRLLELFTLLYQSLFKAKVRQPILRVAEFILGKNIVHGNALDLMTEGDKRKSIVFSEWSPINGSLVKRRDFAFSELVHVDKIVPDETGELFAEISDQGIRAFIPQSVREFTPCHFLKLPDAK